MSSDPLDALEVAPVEHLRGCPAATHEVAQEGSRVERFEADVPTGRTDGRGHPVMRRFVTTRCVECGAQESEEVVDGA